MNIQTNIFKAEDDSAFSFLERLKELSKKDNNKNIIPPIKIINNAIDFLNSLAKESIDISNYEIIVSPYGTIVINNYSENVLISIEIGKTKIGYFTDYEHGINEECDGIVSDFKNIPEQLIKHLI